MSGVSRFYAGLASSWRLISAEVLSPPSLPSVESRGTMESSWGPVLIECFQDFGGLLQILRTFNRQMYKYKYQKPIAKYSFVC